PVPAGEVADAAAQGETGDPCGRDDPAGGGQAEGVGGVVEVAPGGAAAGDRGLRPGVHPHRPHQAEVDDHAAVVGAEAGCAVAAAPDRQVEPVLAGVVHRGDDVGDLLRPDHDLGTPVEDAVVDPAGLVVALVVDGDHRSADLLAQGVHGDV